MVSKERNSGIELFRVLATFLVLTVHFNGWFLGGVPEKLVEYNIPNLLQAFIVACSCICVNCFLVITGWFSVKIRAKSILNILSVVLVAYLVNALIGFAIYDYPIMQIVSAFFVLSRESYYFQCYLMLIILSPILNTFVEKYQQRIFPLVMVFLFVEVYIHWLRKNECLGFMNGYGFTHFVLMYLLGRCAFVYKDVIMRVKRYYYFLLYIFTTMMIFICYLIRGSEFAYSYANPFNVAASFSLFLIFAKMNFSSAFINAISMSTFMVYMLHVCSPFFDVLSGIDNQWFSSLSYGSFLLHQVFLIIAVFIIGILIDKIRMFTLNPILNNLSTKISIMSKNVNYYG